MTDNSPINLTSQQVRLLRIRNQRLWAHARPSEIADLVKVLTGIQAQLFSAMALAIRARTSGLVLKDVSEAIEKRVVVKSWCMRGTLHLVNSQDLSWIVRLLAPSLIGSQGSRYRQLELDEDILNRSSKIIRDTLKNGPMVREQIGSALTKKGIDVSGQRIAHIVQYAALHGIICYGVDIGKKPSYVLVEDWVKAVSKLSGEKALAELARRYLYGFGPADPSDFSSWSGLGMADSKKAWSYISSEMLEIRVANKKLWMLKEQKRILNEIGDNKHVVNLLPIFDVYLLGYKTRDLLVAPEHQSQIYHGGQMSPAVADNGYVVGIWKYISHGKKITLGISAFNTFPGEVNRGIKQEIDDTGRFLGKQISGSST